MTWKSEILTGEYVRLEPLHEDHFDALWRIAQHADIWRYMPYDASTVDNFRRYLQVQMQMHASGQALPFTTFSVADNQPVGATSFLALVPAHRHLEIGSTWITPAYQRSAINTEAKLLQLTDAFERLQCLRVELKTDALNSRSRAAIVRLGAREEGRFRKHMVMPDGRIRDTVWFSITDEEWPGVKQRLAARLQQA